MTRILISWFRLVAFTIRGDFIAGVEEVHRVLKKGGTAVMMVYNAFSYRQWITAPRSTFAQIFNEFGKKPTPKQGGGKERFRYDHNKKKDAAPCTQFIGKRGLLKILEPHFSEVVIRSENIGNSFFLRWLSRNDKLRYLGPFFGLDLYAVLKKSLLLHLIGCSRLIDETTKYIMGLFIKSRIGRLSLPFRVFIFFKDIAHGLIRYRLGGKISGTYNLAFGKGTTIGELAAVINGTRGIPPSRFFL